MLQQFKYKGNLFLISNIQKDYQNAIDHVPIEVYPYISKIFRDKINFISSYLRAEHDDILNVELKQASTSFNLGISDISNRLYLNTLEYADLPVIFQTESGDRILSMKMLASYSEVIAEKWHANCEELAGYNPLREIDNFRNNPQQYEISERATTQVRATVIDMLIEKGPDITYQFIIDRYAYKISTSSVKLKSILFKSIIFPNLS